MPGVVSSPSKPKESPESRERGGRFSSAASSSARAPRQRVENGLSLAVAVLAVMGVGLQLYVERVYTQDVALGTSDEARLSAEISDIETEITRTYTARQIDASADEAGGNGGASDSGQADPTTPNEDGEFEVPPADVLQQRKEVMLASKMLFPIADDSWAELHLASSVPPGSYSLAISGVIGRLAAYGSGGSLLVQVRFHGTWQPLFGSPRRRTQQLDAPLTHAFAVPHPFDGVRVLAATGGADADCGARLVLTRLASSPTHKRPPPQKRSRFLVFELDKGFGATHLGLFNGIALAYLLNVTAVLPRFHTYYDLQTGQKRSDPNHPSSFVPMDEFYDCAHFATTLAPMVKTVRQLPPALAQFASDEQVQPLDFVNPALGATDPSLDLTRLRSHFKAHNVLLLGSAARRLVWNTPDLARLRFKLHAALRPSRRVEALASHVIESIHAFAERKQLPSTAYVGIQLPLGAGWQEYCRQETISSSFGAAVASSGGQGVAGVSGGGMVGGCDMSAEEVTQVLEERQVGELSRILYVASGVLNMSQVEHLHRQRFILMSKARFTVDIHPDLGPAVDLLVCKRAALFIGNLYSSFSFLLREAKLVAGETERTMYYNLDADETLGDLTREEALRWDVMPLGSPPGLMPAHTGARDEL